MHVSAAWFFVSPAVDEWQACYNKLRLVVDVLVFQVCKLRYNRGLIHAVRHNLHCLDRTDCIAFD